MSRVRIPSIALVEAIVPIFTIMSPIESLLLGIVQGLTEFFPVSSSAHLKIAKFLMHLDIKEDQVLFDLSCHSGTLIALLFFLRKKIAGLFQKREDFLFLAMALLPLVPAYFLLKSLRELASSFSLLGFFLMGTGALLFASDRMRFKSSPGSGWKGRSHDVLWIGASQGFALIPGISRSASTISCAQSLGWSAAEAVQFSFLLAIPTILGGNILELVHLLMLSKDPPPLSFSSCLIGFLSSLGVGALMVKPAIRRLSKGNLRPFGWYCLILGGVTILYFVQ